MLTDRRLSSCDWEVECCLLTAIFAAAAAAAAASTVVAVHLVCPRPIDTHCGTSTWAPVADADAAAAAAMHWRERRIKRAHHRKSAARHRRSQHNEII